MEDKTLSNFIRIYSPEDNCRQCILENIKEEPTLNVFGFV